jgi:lysophospholipase L1-like esterase
MVLLLRPDAAFVHPDGSGNVSSLDDQSGAGIVTSVSQSDPTKRPAVGVGVRGLPVLIGDGTKRLESVVSLFTSGHVRTVIIVAETASTGGALITFRTVSPFLCLQATIIPGLHLTECTHDGLSVQNRVNPSFSMTAPAALEFRYVAGPTIPRLNVNGVQQPLNSEVNINVDLSTSDSGTAGMSVMGAGDDLSVTPFIGKVYMIVGYDHDLDATETTAARAHIAAKYGIAFAAASTKDRIVFDGDSITQGSGVGSFTDTWPYLVQQTLGASTWDIADMGLGGTDAGACGIRYSKQCAPLFETVRGRNFLVILIGTNNLVAGGGAVDIYASILAYVHKAVWKGTNFKVYVAGVTGRADALWLASPTAETQRNLLNPMLKANPDRAWHGYIDFPANSILNTAPATHFPDRVHPNALGNALMASIAAAKIAEVQTTASFTGIELDLDATNYNPTTAVWTDASSGAHDFTQAVAANRPTLTSNWRNGKPAVRGDQSGTIQWLECASNIGTPGAAFTQLMVGERVTGNGGGICQYRKAGVFCGIQEYTAANIHYIYSDGVVSNIFLANSWDPTLTSVAFNIMQTMRGVGTQPLLHINHASIPVNTGASGVQTLESGTTGGLLFKTASAGQEIDINLARCIRVDHVLSDDEATKWNSYFWDQYRA